MSNTTPTDFAVIIADRIQLEARSLANRWLDRLLALVPVAANDVFPTESVLDHIPVLVEHIAMFLRTPENEISANTFVVSKARELGELRYQQHASVHQLLREYDLLRNILETFVLEQSKQLHLDAPVDDTLACVRRINQAIAILTQTTVDTFVKRYSSTIEEQTRRLERFNRMVSHELRQPLAALQTAASLLDSTKGDDDPERRARVTAAIGRSVARLVELTTNISRISGMLPDHDEHLSVQRASMTAVAREAARSLRGMAESRGVEIRVSDDLPEVVIDVGQLELLLVNLLSNAVKYADKAKPTRIVDVTSAPSDDSHCVIQVRDNGIGMDTDHLAHVFTPFYRAHAARDAELGVDGLGLGLAIVHDCARAVGAEVTVESAPSVGTTFTLRLPLASAPR